jgi:sec-independent protein translocase protein TatA
MTPGPLQIVLIILVILLLFGGKRIPAIMGDIAKGITSFKKGLKEEDSEPKAVESKKEE